LGELRKSFKPQSNHSRRCGTSRAGAKKGVREGELPLPKGGKIKRKNKKKKRRGRSFFPGGGGKQ